VLLASIQLSGIISSFSRHTEIETRQSRLDKHSTESQGSRRLGCSPCWMPAPEPQIDRLLSWAARTSIRPHHRTGPRNADALVGCERAVPGAAKNHPGGGTPSGRLSMTSPGTPATGSPGSSDGVFGLDPAVALAGPSALVKYAKFGW